MITWRLVRDTFASFGIFGYIYDEKGKKVCGTLEHSYKQDDDNFAPKVPVGTYTCLKGNHTLHSGPIVAFELQHVPGHSGILIHPGNLNDDSQGCILVGFRGQASVNDSRATFNEIMKRFEHTDSFVLEISNEEGK